MSEPNLDNVTKEVLYYALLKMIHQAFSKYPDGYLCDCWISAYERANDIATAVFGWDDTESQLNAEIDRMEKVLIEQGMTRWI